MIYKQFTYKGKYFSNKVWERFNSKYSIPNNPMKCWIWNGWKMNYGYGGFDIKPVKFRAHMVMYILHNGPIPKGMEICHSCDNPSCVNPSHLEAKTHRENIRDASKRNRMNGPRGEKSGKAKLNWKKVNKIRKEYVPRKISSRFLAKKYKVCKDTILYVVKNRTWKEYE